jgi:hypothetical protein
MSTGPIYSDLFAFGRHSIVWLRLFGGSDGVLALAVHPTDQPGAGPVNDAESLVAAVAATFPTVGAFRLLVHFPDEGTDEQWIEIAIDEAGHAGFDHLPTSAVEALVGVSLEDPPDPTCAGIGGSDHPLLALLPDEEEHDPLAELTVIAVADLPFAHGPFRCRWKERFETVRDAYPPDSRERQAVGAQWFLTLTDDDLAACSYHAADWRRVAETATEILRGLAPEQTMDDVLTAIEGRLGESAEAGWCRSLFVDPIVCHRDTTHGVTDGQHRSCALRASGAGLCVVASEDWPGTDPVPADPRRRAAATVSAFWAHRAAR